LSLRADVLLLIDEVTARHGLTPADILSKYADRLATDCRDELYWRLNSRPNERMSAKKIALAFGYTRAAVQNAVNRHRRHRLLAQRGAYD
jgi:hypothetical protein